MQQTIFSTQYRSQSGSQPSDAQKNAGKVLQCFFVLALLLFSSLIAACQPTQPQSALLAQPINNKVIGLAEAKQPEQQNIAVVQKFYDEFAKGNADVILEVYADHLVRA